VAEVLVLCYLYPVKNSQLKLSGFFVFFYYSVLYLNLNHFAACDLGQ